MALPTNADIPFILSRIRPDAEWGWRGGAYADPANLDWRDTVQVEPVLAELEAEWSAFLAEESAQLAVRQQLRTESASTAGVLLSNLTNAETRLLLEIVLFVFGGIDPVTRTVKPVDQWEQAKEVFKL